MRTPRRERHAARLLAAALGLGLISTGAGAAMPVAGKAPSSPAIAASGLHEIQAGQNPSIRAREQAYIGRLEEEIRQLYGRIEQLEYEQRNVNQRIDQLVQDLDERLRALEGGVPGTAGAEGPGPDSAGRDERQRAEQFPDRSGEERRDGELGRVPESAIAGLPRPNPSDVAAPERSTLTPEQQYEKAVQLLQAGDYQGAQGGLETFLDMHGEHQLASNAAYWLAETHYVRQNYSAAAAAFARNYRNYGRDGSKAIDNLLKLGMSLASLGERDKACLTYDELTGSFPNRPAHIQQALSRERARAECG